MFNLIKNADIFYTLFETYLKMPRELTRYDRAHPGGRVTKTLVSCTHRWTRPAWQADLSATFPRAGPRTQRREGARGSPEAKVTGTHVCVWF